MGLEGRQEPQRRLRQRAARRRGTQVSRGGEVWGAAASSSPLGGGGFENSFYAVAKGRQTGIFRSWAACEASVKGYPSDFRSFATYEEAAAFLEGKGGRRREAPSMPPGFVAAPAPAYKAAPALALDNGYPALDDRYAPELDTGIAKCKKMYVYTHTCVCVCVCVRVRVRVRVHGRARVHARVRAAHVTCACVFACLSLVSSL